VTSGGRAGTEANFSDQARPFKIRKSRSRFGATAQSDRLARNFQGLDATQLMADDASTRRPPTKPGLALRKVRTQRGLTLAEMSRRTGLPLSTLSKVENDKMSLTYDKLVRISDALEIDIETLFSADAAQPVATFSGRRSIARVGDGSSVETPEYSYLYPVADLLHKRFVPMIIEAKARTIEEFGGLSHHEGEEYIYVLEGTVDMYSDLYAPTRLNAGESIYFDSGMGHAFIATSPGPCRFLSICSHPEPPRAAYATAESSLARSPPPAPRARRRSA
jgi:transcriptional regulator with XRE-family HTH domain